MNLLYLQRRQTINAVKPIPTLFLFRKPVVGPSDEMTLHHLHQFLGIGWTDHIITSMEFSP